MNVISIFVSFFTEISGPTRAQTAIYPIFLVDMVNKKDKNVIAFGTTNIMENHRKSFLADNTVRGHVGYRTTTIALPTNNRNQKSFSIVKNSSSMGTVLCISANGIQILSTFLVNVKWYQ